MTAEGDRIAGFGRLEDGLKQASPWYTWGPYVSERQWGTVREDYSEDGDVIRRRHGAAPETVNLVSDLLYPRQ